MIKGILPEHEEIIKEILKSYVSDYAFFYYGSRVKGTHSSVSDLDILIKGNKEMPLSLLATIKQVFDASALPYVVNFTDYNKIDISFYDLIKKDLVSVF